MPNKVPFQLSKRARFCPKVLLTIHMLPCIHIPAINVRDLEKTYDDLNLATNLKCNFIGQRCISRYFNSNNQMQAVAECNNRIGSDIDRFIYAFIANRAQNDSSPYRTEKNHKEQLAKVPSPILSNTKCLLALEHPSWACRVPELAMHLSRGSQ